MLMMMIVDNDSPIADQSHDDDKNGDADVDGDDVDNDSPIADQSYNDDHQHQTADDTGHDLLGVRWKTQGLNVRDGTIQDTISLVYAGKHRTSEREGRQRWNSLDSSGGYGRW